MKEVLKALEIRGLAQEVIALIKIAHHDEIILQCNFAQSLRIKF
jgi:hypothetical protein